ncbi:Protein of unknown function [Cotesia congregata]|uniref:Uncharacterized protein n=1 Tax=Cotesia congregata TaxID=51543 RepID=A0A8J2HQE4_COTCN|nr:Protein of unknown function [Cotesia congregata]
MIDIKFLSLSHQKSLSNLNMLGNADPVSSQIARWKIVYCLLEDGILTEHANNILQGQCLPLTLLISNTALNYQIRKEPLVCKTGWIISHYKLLVPGPTWHTLLPVRKQLYG